MIIINVHVFNLSWVGFVSYHVMLGNVSVNRTEVLKYSIMFFFKVCEKILLELFCHADSIPFQQKVSKSVSGTITLM